jgi:hypothetical protein
VGVPKSRQMGLPGLWNPITLQADLGSRCDLKQSCSSRRVVLSEVVTSSVLNQSYGHWLFNDALHSIIIMNFHILP